MPTYCVTVADVVLPNSDPQTLQFTIDSSSFSAARDHIKTVLWLEQIQHGKVTPGLIAPHKPT